MKCELCHKNDAETAIQSVKDGREEEFYVCKECAKGERLRRQKKSQRTRKIGGLPPGVSMSVTRIGGDDGEKPPPIIEAIMNAMTGMVSDLAAADKEAREKKEAEKEFRSIDLGGVNQAFKVGDALHLEGLFLVGEIEPVHRAMRAVGLRLSGFPSDGIADSGHVYRLMFQDGDGDKAGRILETLVEQERNARARLFGEMPRVFGDSLCRALAVLKNCRLLSPGELFDLLSPLRLAAMDKMLDGLTLRQVEKLMADVKLDSSEDSLDQEERDRLDAERADEMNARFEDVVLNERAEDRFL